MIRTTKKKDTYKSSLLLVQQAGASKIIFSIYQLYQENNFNETLSPIRFESTASSAYTNLIKLLCNYEDINLVLKSKIKKESFIEKIRTGFLAEKGKRIINVNNINR